ncbi:MAG: TIGR00296 family protein, partial [Candidatus Hadarchaeales archaeon]
GHGILPASKMLSLDEGKLLVKFARETIEKYVVEGSKPKLPEVRGELRKPRGVFVTLTKDDDLRGCIGFPFPTLPLIEATAEAAISSATKDPRFPPVTSEELREIVVEVSVLTEPELIKVKSPAEYPKHVEIGKDGLIVEWRGFSGLLLPQVAVEWGWDAEEFLSNACVKAGLPPDCWLERDVKIKKNHCSNF